MDDAQLVEVGERRQELRGDAARVPLWQRAVAFDAVEEVAAAEVRRDQGQTLGRDAARAVGRARAWRADDAEEGEEVAAARRRHLLEQFHPLLRPRAPLGRVRP